MKIYIMPNCRKCKKLMEVFPDAEVYNLLELSRFEQDHLLDLCRSIGQKVVPIVMDEEGNIIGHEELNIAV